MIVPKRFVSICARKSDIGVSSTDERLPYPALLITTSSEPKAPIAAFTALAAADSSVTSSAKSLIWSPWRSDRSCRDSMSLAVANTLLPAARPASTIARPRPRELPVTNQTCAIHPPLSSHPPDILEKLIKLRIGGAMGIRIRAEMAKLPQSSQAIFQRAMLELGVLSVMIGELALSHR